MTLILSQCARSTSGTTSGAQAQRNVRPRIAHSRTGMDLCDLFSGAQETLEHMQEWESERVVDRERASGGGDRKGFDHRRLLQRDHRGALEGRHKPEALRRLVFLDVPLLRSHAKVTDPTTSSNTRTCFSTCS